MDEIGGRISSAGCARVPEGGTGDMRSEVRWSLEVADEGEQIPEFLQELDTAVNPKGKGGLPCRPPW